MSPVVFPLWGLLQVLVIHFYVIYLFGPSIMFFLFLYLTSTLFGFLFILLLICPCVLFTVLLVEFSFLILESTFLFVLLYLVLPSFESLFFNECFFVYLFLPVV